MSIAARRRNGANRGAPPVVAAAVALVGALAALLAVVELASAARQASTRLAAVIRDGSRGAEAMLQEVTLPAETELQAWSNVREVRTATRDGETTIVLEISDCGLRCADDVWTLGLRRRLIDAGIPGAAIAVQRLDTAAVTLDVAVPDGEEPERSRFALEVVRPALLAAPGVERVDVFGATRWRALVTPLAAELSARGATAGDLAAALCDLGRERAAGRVLDGGVPRPVSLRERFASLDTLARWPLRLGGAVSPVADVADVRLAATDDGTLFRTGGATGVLLRVRGAAPGARSALAALRAPAGLRLVARTAADEREIAFEAPSTAAFIAAFPHPGAASPAGATEAWATWIADTGRAGPETPLAANVPAAARGTLLVPRALALAESALAERGLVPMPEDVTELWLSAAEESDLGGLLREATAAADSLDRPEPALPAAPARARLTLRADLDAATRRAIADDVAASLGLSDCGRVEIPGAWPAGELAPTRVPRLSLLPVHAGPGGIAVPLAAALVEEPTVSASPVSLRRNGWPAAVLRFRSLSAAERVQQTLDRRRTAATVVMVGPSGARAARADRVLSRLLVFTAIALLSAWVAIGMRRRRPEPEP